MISAFGVDHGEIGKSLAHPLKTRRAKLDDAKHMLVVHQVGAQMARATGQKVKTRYGTVINP